MKRALKWAGLILLVILALPTVAVLLNLVVGESIQSRSNSDGKRLTTIGCKKYAAMAEHAMSMRQIKDDDDDIDLDLEDHSIYFMLERADVDPTINAVKIARDLVFESYKYVKYEDDEAFRRVVKRFKDGKYQDCRRAEVG